MSDDSSVKPDWKRREFLRATSSGALAAATWWAVTVKNDALADNSDAKSLAGGNDADWSYPYEP